MWRMRTPRVAISGVANSGGHRSVGTGFRHFNKLPNHTLLVLALDHHQHALVDPGIDHRGHLGPVNALLPDVAEPERLGHGVADPVLGLIAVPPLAGPDRLLHLLEVLVRSPLPSRWATPRP